MNVEYLESIFFMYGLDIVFNIAHENAINLMVID